MSCSLCRYCVGSSPRFGIRCWNGGFPTHHDSTTLSIAQQAGEGFWGGGCCTTMVRRILLQFFRPLYYSPHSLSTVPLLYVHLASTTSILRKLSSGPSNPVCTRCTYERVGRRFVDTYIHSLSLSIYLHLIYMYLYIHLIYIYIHEYIYTPDQYMHTHTHRLTLVGLYKQITRPEALNPKLRINRHTFSGGFLSNP